MKKILLPGLTLYALLSGPGFFIDSGPAVPFMLPWLAGYVFLAFSASYLSLFSKERPRPLIYIMLAVIGLNFVAQATGGASSHFRYGYFVLVAAAAAFAPAADAYKAAGLALTIEAANILASRQAGDGLWTGYAGFAVSLAGSVIVAVPVIGRIKKQARSAVERHERLLADANEVDPLADDKRLSSLTEHNRQASNVSAAVEREGAFKGLIDMISGLVPAHTYALFLADRDKGAFVLRAIRSDSRHICPVGAVQFSKGSGLIGICADKNQPQYLPDMVIPAKSLGYYKQDVPVKSFLAISIAQDDRTLGVLVVDSLERDAFSPDAQDMLSRFSPFFSTIIEKIRISQEMDLKAKNFGALHEMSAVLSSSLELEEVLDRLTSELKSVVPYDFCAFARYDEKKDEAVIAAVRGYEPGCRGKSFPIRDSVILGQMLTQWKERRAAGAYHFSDLGARGREINLFPSKDMQRPIQALSCWPLVARERFIGWFFIGSVRANALTDYHKQFIDTLMNQVSVVIDNAILHHRIKDMARTDGLTGLLNHRTFMEKLGDEFKRLERDPRASFSLLLADIDFFKKVNDTHGHPAGDAALARVADALRELARGSDFVARYGGEEFAVGMVGADGKGAAQMAERLRKIVEKTNIIIDRNTEIRVTLSIGVAAHPEDGSSPAALVAAADAALYHAKRTGRNRIGRYKDTLQTHTDSRQPAADKP